MILFKILTYRNAKVVLSSTHFKLSQPTFSSSATTSSSPSTSSNNTGTEEKRCSLAKAGKLGQPTPWTHQHLLKVNELVPGIEASEFQRRRLRLMQTLVETDSLPIGRSEQRKHIAIIPSAHKKYMSGKIPYTFRQNSDFYYLTACLEPDSILVMTHDGKSESKTIMFVHPKDKHAELWDGPRTGVDNSIELFAVDEAYPITSFRAELNRRMQIEKNANKPLIWYDMSSSELEKINTDLKELSNLFDQIKSPEHVIHAMRLFKSPAEANLMRKTCKIASESINETMRESIPGHSEHQIHAMVEYKCRMRNASYLAYPPVVACGDNATTIHYINNTQITKSGDLVLMDAGCEYAGYTSDITRTWPVNGEFSLPQKTLYDVVHQTQKELIETLLKEGGETLDQLFETMCLKLGKYLQEIRLIPQEITDKVKLAKAGYEFCPHHVSHYLGLDVHDTAQISRNTRLLPGMVFTVEPGVYIASDRLDVAKEYRGIGIRIEDNILIRSENSIEILTADCIKDSGFLEKHIKEGKQSNIK